MFECGRKEPLRRFGAVYAPLHEQAGQSGRNPGFSRQPPCFHSIPGTEIPAHGLVLVFLVGFVNGDAAEVVQQFHDPLVALVPLR